MLGLFFWLIKMIAYLQQLFARFFDYISSFWKSVTEKPRLSDNGDNVDELYMHKIEMQQLQNIISYFRDKENQIKRKCKLR